MCGRRLRFYPFLFAAYPVLFLFAQNRGSVTLREVLPSLAIVLAVVTLLLVFLRLLTGTYDRAALSVTLTLLLFFSFGHVFTFLGKSLHLDDFRLYQTLLIIYSVFLIIGNWWILRLMPQPGSAITMFLNVSSAVALLVPIYTIATTSLLPLANGQRVESAALTLSSAEKSDELLPDVYFIVLDGYGREDILATIYQYDNTSFLDSLRSRDFYIVEDSYSNYIRTAQSVPATMNMGYLGQLSDESDHSDTQSDVSFSIGNGQVINTFRDLGYEIVSFSTGFDKTSLQDADLYLTPFKVTPNNFEELLLRNTLPALFLEGTFIHFSYSAHRERILFTYEKLGELPYRDGPQFVLAHILAAHPPFVFGPDGSARKPARYYSLSDGGSYDGSRQEYIEGYRDQLTYINQLTLKAVDDILRNSKIPPVIIIQGDHGPGALLSWSDPDNSCLQERFGILNAYYLPGDATAFPYGGISPVNTFRLIFDRYFNGKLPLLPDRSYYSTVADPTRFTDVTTRRSLTCALVEGE